MRPSATVGVENPPPRPVIFQASGGPLLGHSLSSPVSVEAPVRSGPRHCGQSVSADRRAAAPAANAARATMQRVGRILTPEREGAAGGGTGVPQAGSISLTRPPAGRKYEHPAGTSV